MREVGGLGPSLDRVDSEGHYMQTTLSTIAGSSILVLKLGFDCEYSKLCDFFKITFSSFSIHWNLEGAPG